MRHCYQSDDVYDEIHGKLSKNQRQRANKIRKMKDLENLMDKAIERLKNPPISENINQMIVDELVKDGHLEDVAKTQVKSANITVKNGMVNIAWKDGSIGLYKFQLIERLYHVSTIRNTK